MGVTDEIVAHLVTIFEDEETKSVSFEEVAEVIAAFDDEIREEVEQKLKKKGFEVTE